MQARPKSKILSQGVRRARLNQSPDIQADRALTGVGFQVRRTVNITERIEVTAPF
jgi:hypothetical protein